MFNSYKKAIPNISATANISNRKDIEALEDRVEELEAQLTFIKKLLMMDRADREKAILDKAGFSNK